MLLTNTKMACSGLTLIRLRITYMNWPTLRSAGTRYFFLSMSGISERWARSTITWKGEERERGLGERVGMKNKFSLGRAKENVVDRNVPGLYLDTFHVFLRPQLGVSLQRVQILEL